MRQVLQDRQSGEIRVAEVPTPAVRAGGVLVATRASLISTGTERATVTLGAKSLMAKARARPDLVRKVVESVRSKGLIETIHTVRARLAEPSVLGYSAAGDVLERGEGVDDLAPGDQVACVGQGVASHAEVNFVPRNLVVPLPTGVDYEAGSFVALGAIALHGVRTAGIEVGDHVAVIGLGLVGLVTVQLLRAAGCVVYGLDLRPERASLARELGAGHASTAADDLATILLDGTDGRGADAVLVTASTPSSEPVELAGRMARDRGSVCVVGDVGLEIPRELYYEKELAFRISRSYGPGRYDPAYELAGQAYPVGFVPWDQRRNMAAFLDMVARGDVRVGPLISARCPVEAAAEAYARLTGGASAAAPPIAVLLTYPEGAARRSAPSVMLRPATPGRPGAGVAVIGAGHFARATLLPRLARAEGLRRVIVVTTSGPSARTAAEDFGFEQAGTSVEEALAHPDVGMVIVATRHDTHARTAATALRAGHAVFVEKPLAITDDELEGLALAIAESGNVRLMVGFNRRFSAHAMQLRRHFAAGAEAVSYRVNAGRLPPDHWTRRREEGGGRIVGEGCHFIDLMSFLVRSRVREVHAYAVPPADGGTPDTVLLNLAYESGAVGNLLYASVGDPRMPKEQLAVFGGGRSAVLANFQRLEVWGEGRRSVHRARFKVDKGFDGEIEAFLGACATGTEMPIPLADLFNTTRATFAAERSLATRQPIAVPHDGPLGA